LERTTGILKQQPELLPHGLVDAVGAFEEDLADLNRLRVEAEDLGHPLAVLTDLAREALLLFLERLGLEKEFVALVLVAGDLR
jgi:hypothetical protein